VYEDGRPIDRIYEAGSTSTLPELRWGWSITIVHFSIIGSVNLTTRRR
jgi:hypothetical protein